MVDRLHARWKAVSASSRLRDAWRRSSARLRAAFVGLLFATFPAVSYGSAPCTEGLTVDWRFNAAAPVVEPPAVSNDGWIVLGSVDGYVHALSSQGRFQWSYTLDSAPSGIALGDDDRTYALSREGVLHVMLPSGGYQWGGRLPAGMLPTGALAHSERGVVFVPSELNLYAFSAASGLMWRTFVGSPITSGPLVSPDGDAWVGTRTGRVMRIRSPKQHTGFTTPTKAEVLLAYAENDWVLARTTPSTAQPELVSYGAAGNVRWRRSDVARVSADGRLLRGSGRRRSLWTWIEPATGRVVAERELALEDSARPARFGNFAVVPTNSGRVYLFGEEGAVEWCQVSTAPLLEARVRREAGQVIAAAGDGWIAAVRFRAPHERARRQRTGADR